jgi:hypothetical protein
MLETSALHLDVRTFDDKTHKVIVRKTAAATWKAFAHIDHRYIQGQDAPTPRGAVEHWEAAYESRFAASPVS